jgi:hypothetical protein
MGAAMLLQLRLGYRIAALDEGDANFLPDIVVNGDHSGELDLRMRFEHILHFPWIDELPEFAHLVQGLNRRWHDRISRSVFRHYPEGALAPENALLAAYMLGAMMDELVRRLIIYPDQDFHKLLRELGMDDNGLADAASAVWARVLYPGLEIEAELAPSAAAFALWAGNPPAVSTSAPR